MSKIWIGIDNGVSGTIGIIGTDWSSFVITPTKSEQSYTKTKQKITRINYSILKAQLEVYNNTNLLVVLERPMVNPGRFKATASALRSLEATLIVLEELHYPFMYCDSKEWQKVLLPNIPTTNNNGKKLKSPERSKLLKEASADIGVRLFPKHEYFIRKHKDADGLLIAEWARRSNL